jgi:hypothetical protein
VTLSSGVDGSSSALIAIGTREELDERFGITGPVRARLADATRDALAREGAAALPVVTPLRSRTIKFTGGQRRARGHRMDTPAWMLPLDSELVPVVYRFWTAGRAGATVMGLGQTTAEAVHYLVAALERDQRLFGPRGRG